MSDKAFYPAHTNDIHKDQKHGMKIHFHTNDLEPVKYQNIMQTVKRPAIIHLWYEMYITTCVKYTKLHSHLTLLLYILMK